MGSFEKTLKFFKIAKGSKFAIECVSDGIISLKCLFRPNYEVFWQKNQKIVNVGKIRKYDEETVFFSRKKSVLMS